MDVEDGFNAEDLFGGKKYGSDISWNKTRKGCFIQILQRKHQRFYENSKNLFLIC